MLDSSHLFPVLVGWTSLYHPRISRLVSWLVNNICASVSEIRFCIIVPYMMRRQALQARLSQVADEIQVLRTRLFARVHTKLESSRHVCGQERWKVLAYWSMLPMSFSCSVGTNDGMLLASKHGGGLPRRTINIRMARPNATSRVCRQECSRGLNRRVRLLRYVEPRAAESGPWRYPKARRSGH